jgi:tetratricopeptide (TPR) repeat protein
MKAKKKPVAAAPVKPAIQPQHYWLAGLALVVLTLLAFSNSFNISLTLDNQVLIAGDPRIRQWSGQNLGQILQHTFWWPNGEAGIYRPFTTFSFLFNYAVLGNGVQTAGYHWINFLLHAINVLLVFALALHLLRCFRVSLCIAGLWAVHPVLTESVTNIIGRADLLAAMSVLAGFLMYLKSAERPAWLVGVMCATAVGVFSKESAVVLPGVIVLYELTCQRPRRLRALLYGCLATLPPIAVMLWQRALVLAASPRAEFPFVDNPIAGADFWTGRLTAIKVIARYLWLTIWPAKLSADYSYSEIPLARGSFDDWIAWIAVAVTLCFVALLWKRNRLAFFFACSGFLNLLPVSTLLFPLGTIMAERFLYLPLACWLACLVMLVDSAAGRTRYAHLAPVLFALIAIGFSVRTWMRNRDWKDDLTMATAIVQTSPNSFKGHRLLAVSLFLSAPDYSNINQVLEEANKSLAILQTLPDHLNVPGPWNEAASYYLAKGDPLQAVRLAQRSIAIAPQADAYRTLASAYLRLSKGVEALSAAKQAQMLDPSNVDVYGQIADAYIAQSRGEDAAIALAQGMFTTSNGSLREDLLKLYQSGVDSQGCAVVAGPRGPALNPSCDIVLRDLCTGATRAHRPDLLGQLPCPAKYP